MIKGILDKFKNTFKILFLPLTLLTAGRGNWTSFKKKKGQPEKEDVAEIGGGWRGRSEEEGMLGRQSDKYLSELRNAWSEKEKR